MNDVATIEPKSGAIVESAKRALTLGEQLKQKQPQFMAALPAHIPAERFLRVIATAIQNNPALWRADRQSLWNSAMKAATDGLLPDGREGALVIYKTKSAEKDAHGRDVWIEKVQWMPMIAGIRKKVRNSNEIATWEVQVVHAKDHFEFELGDDPFIKHKPLLDGDAGPVVAAYSVATLKTGEKSREVMTRAQIEKVRSVSKSKDKGPWVDWYEEMCRKVVARRHSKVLPMSTDLDDLMRRDDDLYDLSGARQNAAERSGGPQTLSAKMDLLADGAAEVASDPETGEEEIVPDKQLHEESPAMAPADAASANPTREQQQDEAAAHPPVNAASSKPKGAKAPTAADGEDAASRGVAFLRGFLKRVADQNLDAAKLFGAERLEAWFRAAQKADDAVAREDRGGGND